jgi:uncharacterized protein (TIGR03790 family)
VYRFIIAFSFVLMAGCIRAEGLTAERLGVVYDLGDPSSERVAEYYAARRHVPAVNMIGLEVPGRAVIGRADLARMRAVLLARLPSEVQSLLLVWSRPYAVECMSITSGIAAGYQPGFCEPGCGRTTLNPLFDSQGWIPADTVGWLPAMLLPTEDEALARAVVERGVRADGSRPPGTVYLVRTQDSSRNVRSAGYADTEALLARRVRVLDETTPLHGGLPDAIGYFTGAERVAELRQIGFRPGAIADHLTSTGGVLQGSGQMSALEWLEQGATGSYGTVSEPCNRVGKFPSPAVFLDHYLRGETLLEAYWKSVAMPGQGLFIGEPLARPYAAGS